MRYKAGKRAVIIDHVGNYARFGMPDADRKWSLENKKKSAEKHSVEAEVKALQCPECFYTFEPPKFGRPVCPSCGYIFPKKERTLEKEEDTQLEKITGFVLNYDFPDECRNMQELQDYAKKWAINRAGATIRERNEDLYDTRTQDTKRNPHSSCRPMCFVSCKRWQRLYERRTIFRYRCSERIF
jgi:hypothetical protein